MYGPSRRPELRRGTAGFARPGRERARCERARSRETREFARRNIARRERESARVADASRRASIAVDANDAVIFARARDFLIFAGDSPKTCLITTSRSM